MIEHSSTPENLHSLLYKIGSSADDALEWAYRCHLEKLLLEIESYARLCICLLSRRDNGDGLKMPSGEAESYARLCSCLLKRDDGDGLMMPSWAVDNKRDS